ncbi:unnamed protein product [Closterium sp. NIES-65]|nr:unnamed protein product [Closterium sp. NIES-65]
MYGAYFGDEILDLRLTAIASDPSPATSLHLPPTCEICSDVVGLSSSPVDDDGRRRPFVACSRCGLSFPICRACVAYERKHGANACLNCNLPYDCSEGSDCNEASDCNSSFLDAETRRCGAAAAAAPAAAARAASPGEQQGADGWELHGLESEGSWAGSSGRERASDGDAHSATAERAARAEGAGRAAEAERAERDATAGAAAAAVPATGFGASVASMEGARQGEAVRFRWQLQQQEEKQQQQSWGYAWKQQHLPAHLPGDLPARLTASASQPTLSSSTTSSSSSSSSSSASSASSSSSASTFPYPRGRNLSPSASPSVPPSPWAANHSPCTPLPPSPYMLRGLSSPSSPYTPPYPPLVHLPAPALPNTAMLLTTPNLSAASSPYLPTHIPNESAHNALAPYRSQSHLALLLPTDAGTNKLVTVNEPCYNGSDPPLTTANTLLSILAMDYPTDRVSCYLSDEGASLLTFQMVLLGPSGGGAGGSAGGGGAAAGSAAAAAAVGGAAGEFEKGMERSAEKRSGVTGNGTASRTEKGTEKAAEEGADKDDKGATEANELARGTAAAGAAGAEEGISLPRLVYVAREKRPGYNEHGTAGALNALLRVSALLSNAPFLLILAANHYVNNAAALREAMCFLMDGSGSAGTGGSRSAGAGAGGGEGDGMGGGVGNKCCFVQFPLRFDGVDESDRYDNHNTVFYDLQMPALDADPHTTAATAATAGRGYEEDTEDTEATPLTETKRYERRFGKSPLLILSSFHDARFTPAARTALAVGRGAGVTGGAGGGGGGGSGGAAATQRSSSGTWSSTALVSQGTLLKETIRVLSCGYEDLTDWGKHVGWLYHSNAFTHPLLTGLTLHSRGWRSVYCCPPRPAVIASSSFSLSSPPSTSTSSSSSSASPASSAHLNLSDRLHQVLLSSIGATELALSSRSPVWFGLHHGHLKLLQRIAYINTVLSPFTSVPLLIYCLLPGLCLLFNSFILPKITTTAVLYLLALLAVVMGTSVLEVQWSGVTLTDLWRAEQFWVVGGVSAHLFAVVQGVLKVVAGIDTSVAVKENPNSVAAAGSAGDDKDGEHSELYTFKWTALLLPPALVVGFNAAGIVVGIAQGLNGGLSAWGMMLIRVAFALWVIMHLHPLIKGFFGKERRLPPLVLIWGVLLSSVLTLLWVNIDPFGYHFKGPDPVLCGIRC